MIVKCVSRSGGMKLEKEYFVCGIVLFDHKLFYLIYDDYEMAATYDANLFQITDSSLPEGWFYNIDEDSRVSFGYKEFVFIYEHARSLIEDQEENAMKLFLKRTEEMNVVIQILLLEKDDFYKDLVVKVKGRDFIKKFDSFYLENDSECDEYKNDSYPEKLEGIKKVKAVLVQLLKYWLENVNTLENNENCYLPIDFSDEHTGCFQVKREGESFILFYGSSSKEGWSIPPSSPGDFSKEVIDFKKDENFKELTVTRSALILSIKEMIRKFSENDKRN